MMMSDPDRERDDELMAIPRLAERIGVTPRVLRYWEEQQLISPTREHGKLRYSPRDLAIAALIRLLLDAGAGVEGIRMLKRLAERDIRRAAATGEEAALAEEALRILYQRKAFREETGTDEEHYQAGKSPPPPPYPPPPPHGPKAAADRDARDQPSGTTCRMFIAVTRARGPQPSQYHGAARRTGQARVCQVASRLCRSRVVALGAITAAPDT
jgi:DNA-binding transcriptional MerR regulator